MAEIAADKAAACKPGDPVDYHEIVGPRYDVQMPARDPGIIITHDVEADEWCRDQCRGTWARAIERGDGREGCIPVYRFIDKDDAFWFKVRFR